MNWYLDILSPLFLLWIIHPNSNFLPSAFLIRSSFLLPLIFCIFNMHSSVTRYVLTQTRKLPDLPHSFFTKFSIFLLSFVLFCLHCHTSFFTFLVSSFFFFFFCLTLPLPVFILASVELWLRNFLLVVLPLIKTKSLLIKFKLDDEEKARDGDRDHRSDWKGWNLEEYGEKRGMERWKSEQRR